MSFWLRVSVELLRMSVSVLRTIELDALQIFKAVVDFGGVTRAAAHLHRVPSNVTTRLKQLEEGLGTKLFHRQSRKLLLSTEGKLLLTYAEQLLRLSSEAELALRSGKPRGKLRIGTLECTAATRLPPVLARYHRANPEVQIELVTGTTGALLEQVSRYAIEAAFVAERFEPDGLEMMPVFREKLVVIAPKEITAIKNVGDIRGMTVIAFGAGCSYRRTLEEWLARSKITPERVLEFGSYHAIVACVAAGSGIALVPHSVVHGSHDVSCLAQRTSFCCSRRFTSRTGSGERRLNTSPKFVRSVQRTSPLDLGATRLQKNGRFGRHPSPSCANTLGEQLQSQQTEAWKECK
jgi:DNA-binding transcriptional LysR family regulator